MHRGSSNVPPSGSVIDSPTFTGIHTGDTWPLAQSWAAVSCPADTSEDTLATITIPANALGANGSIRLHAQFSMTSSANNKTMRVRFSGGSGTQYLSITQTTISNGLVDLVIANRGATNSQVGTTLFFTGGGALQLNNGSTPPTSAVDTTAQTTIVITGQKASAGETLTLEGYIAEMIR